jgi:hypothetical protein
LCNTLLSKANRRSITNMVFRNLLFYRWKKCDRKSLKFLIWSTVGVVFVGDSIFCSFSWQFWNIVAAHNRHSSMLPPIYSDQ